MTALRATAKTLEDCRPDGCIEVETTWSGVVLDRTDGVGYALKATHMALAMRLVKAINDQKVFLDPVIKTDIYGQTYVSHRTVVHGRCLNASLRRIGY